VGKIEQLCRTHLPDIYLTGNYLRGISLNECVLHAEKVVQQILKSTIPLKESVAVHFSDGSSLKLSKSGVLRNVKGSKSSISKGPVLKQAYGSFKTNIHTTSSQAPRIQTTCIQTIDATLDPPPETVLPDEMLLDDILQAEHILAENALPTE
jgi:hypothetical protein